MTIIGRGDLAPPRRHASAGRWLVSAVVVGLLAGGGFAAYLGLTGGSSSTSRPQALPACPVASPSAAPKGPKLRLAILNATLRPGLAARVRTDFRRRGFTVISVGNAPKLATNVATVRYPASKQIVAEHVAAQITGAKLVVSSEQPSVELDLGQDFRGLASIAAAKAALATAIGSASPAPSASPTCRPSTSAP